MSVRNLKAMFESRGENSPPGAEDRGRSPGAHSAGTQSPRPISKVRTNFIAVEKDGRVGLQDPSRESSVAGSTRKPSGDPETPSLSRSTSYDRPTASPDDKKGATPPKTSLKEQPIPESPGVKSPSEMTADLLPGQAANSKQEAPPINPDNNIDVEEPNTKMVVGGPTDASAVTGNGSILPSGGFGECLNGTGGGKEKKSTEPVQAKSPRKLTPSKSAAPKPVVTTKTAPKSATATPSKSLKSPTTSAAPKPANKGSDKPGAHAAHPTRTSAPRESTSTVKPATSSVKPAAKKPPPLETSPKSTGFVKPKPKSPTRPVKLPPSLTTHTAASATKFNVRRESHGSSEGRSNSRASLSGATTKAAPTTTSEKGLTRKTSTISRAPRPSIGPPPKQPSKDQPAAKKESKVDEGFLARMMRPTQASAQKTAEKAPTTPPKKTSAAPPTKTSAPVEKRITAPAVTKAIAAAAAAAAADRKPNVHVTKKADAPVAKKVAASVDSKVLEPVKKAVAKTAQAVSNSTTSATKPEDKGSAVHAKGSNKPGQDDKTSGQNTEGHTQPKDSKPSVAVAKAITQVVTPVVEHAATAEEIINVANKTEGHVPLPKDVDLPSPKEASTISDIAPVVEQLESADLAIEAAKVADGDYTIPEQPIKPVVKGMPTTVKEVAPIVEQLESAEEAIEAAKAVDLSADLTTGLSAADETPPAKETSPVDLPAPQEASSIKDIAPVVVQLESAEEAIEAAKVTDGDYTLPEQPVKPVITGAPSLKEVAPVVEQIDSAEEAIRVAKKADGETSLPTELSAPGDIVEEDGQKQNGAPSEVPPVVGGHDKVG